jgi:hypothetical protein
VLAKLRYVNNLEVKARPTSLVSGFLGGYPLPGYLFERTGMTLKDFILAGLEIGCEAPECLTGATVGPIVFT